MVAHPGVSKVDPLNMEKVALVMSPLRDSLVWDCSAVKRRGLPEIVHGRPEMMTAMRLKSVLGTGMVLIAVGNGAAQLKQEPKGPLAGLPSKPGSTIDKIKALGDNEWLELGSPAPDPQWGKARGRSWSSKMSYAADLQGAFLVGPGVHGYIKPDGHFDDVFFYDLNAHRWIRVFPGIQTRTLVEDIKKGKFKVNDDGQLVDQGGQPLFTGYCHHSYQSHTYA